MASIQKRPDGVWRARYRDEGGREHSKHFGRKIDARQWLDEVTASVVTGRYVDPIAGRVTFRQYVAQWLPRQVWETGTVSSFSNTVANVPFADLPMSVIRRSHVEAWIKELATRLRPSTIHTRWVHVRQVFRAAVADRVIPEDPSDGVTLPRRRKAEHAMVIPTPEQVGAILEQCSIYFRSWVMLCAFAGLRQGEANAVQVGDIDFLGRKLHVQRQRQRDEVRAPKYGSERVVFLPDGLVEALSIQVRDFGHHEDGWLFVGERGPAGDNWASYQFRTAAKLAKVTGVTPHTLRHFYASGLIASGCDVVTVQRALGHAAATTTLNTYSHLWPTAEDRTRTAAGGLWSQVLADSPRTGGTRNTV